MPLRCRGNVTFNPTACGNHWSLCCGKNKPHQKLLVIAVEAISILCGPNPMCMWQSWKLHCSSLGSVNLEFWNFLHSRDLVLRIRSSRPADPPASPFRPALRSRFEDSSFKKSLHSSCFGSTCTWMCQSTKSDIGKIKLTFFAKLDFFFACPFLVKIGFLTKC